MFELTSFNRHSSLAHSIILILKMKKLRQLEGDGAGIWSHAEPRASPLSIVLCSFKEGKFHSLSQTWRQRLHCLCKDRVEKPIIFTFLDSPGKRPPPGGARWRAALAWGAPCTSARELRNLENRDGGSSSTTGPLPWNPRERSCPFPLWKWKVLSYTGWEVPV